MAILQAGRNSGSSDGSAPWLGIQKARMVEFRDESAKWDWAEIYLLSNDCIRMGRRNKSVW